MKKQYFTARPLIDSIWGEIPYNCSNVSSRADVRSMLAALKVRNQSLYRAGLSLL